MLLAIHKIQITVPDGWDDTKIQEIIDKVEEAYGTIEQVLLNIDSEIKVEITD